MLLLVLLVLAFSRMGGGMFPLDLSAYQAVSQWMVGLKYAARSIPWLPWVVGGG